MNHQPKWRDINGFSLVELLVVILITGIMMAMIISVFLMSQKIYTHGGDISYKQKSITNVETELQNNLATAISVQLLSAPVADSTYYNIGIDADGHCVQQYYDESKKSFDTYNIGEISDIDLKVVQNASNKKVLNYQLEPQKSMSVLEGGIIMNNSNITGFNLDPQLANNVNGDYYSLLDNKPKYLVIKCAIQ